jgi:hypothetical protein
MTQAYNTTSLSSETDTPSSSTSNATETLSVSQDSSDKQQRIQIIFKWFKHQTPDILAESALIYATKMIEMNLTTIDRIRLMLIRKESQFDFIDELDMIDIKNALNIGNVSVAYYITNIFSFVK